MHVWIGLGANQQKPVEQIRESVRRMQLIAGVDVISASSLYRTPPWGDTDQEDFINAVVLLETDLKPVELLHHLQRIETAMGRVRKDRRWGPRLIDIDILMYGQQRIELDELVVPHTHMHERAFVLLPLLELSADIEIPGRGRADTLLSQLEVGGMERLTESIVN